MKDLVDLISTFHIDVDVDEFENELVCNRCGEDGLHWEHRQGKWKLFDEYGREHEC